MGKGQELYKRAKTIIPGGTQLLSKRPEMFLPDHWPAYYRKAKGSYVWDLDGKRYADVCYMGIGACSLGFADPDVNRAVGKVLRNGNMATLNSPEEVELAEILLELHPWADMARFTRTGGEAMSVAIRIARASSARSTVVFSGYHGWHDWYLAANIGDDQALDGQLLPGLKPAGVPRNLKGTSIPVAYNDVDELKKILAGNDDVGVIVLESIRNDNPTPEFIQAINTAASEKGIVVIIDEITAGFRLNLGGAHLIFGFIPGMAVFAKALGNGIPVAAIIGRRNIMEAAQTTFISSTYWTERMGPAAAVATIKKMRERTVQKYLVSIGQKVQDGWKRAAESAGIHIHIGGIAPLGHFAFDGQEPLLFKTIYTQEMLKRGFIASTAFYSALTHRTHLVDHYLDETESVFRIIKAAQDSGDPMAYLDGPVCHSGFKRLN